jgi:hypothetical protein
MTGTSPVKGQFWDPSVLSRPVPDAKAVVPAKAGIHFSVPETAEAWVPAFAGTTVFIGP